MCSNKTVKLLSIVKTDESDIYTYILPDLQGLDHHSCNEEASLVLV